MRAVTVMVNKYNGGSPVQDYIEYSALTGISCIIPLLQWPVTRHTKAFDASHPCQCIRGKNKQIKNDQPFLSHFWGKIEFPI